MPDVRVAQSDFGVILGGAGIMEFIFGGVIVCAFYIVRIYFVLDDIRRELKTRKEVQE